MTRFFVGIDVQASRGCAFAILDRELFPVDAGWLTQAQPLVAVVERLGGKRGRVFVGIDAPRQPLARPRPHYWERARWRSRRDSDRGHGRHCEVVIAAARLANPQWTPLRGQCPEWMEIGFRLFAALGDKADVFEVFPSASYAQLTDELPATLRITLKGFAPGPKDMLDAHVAAYTVHEFVSGRGAGVGGGDGLGKIILPRRLSPEMGESPVLCWPR